MKKNGYLIASIVACSLLAVCMYKLISLENRVENMQQYMNSQFDNLSSGINRVPSQLQDTLTEQASLLSAESWEFGAPDIGNSRISVNCSVTPKEFSPEDTKAFLIMEGKEYPMTLEGSKFTAMLEIPLFTDSYIESVVFRESGRMRTQMLEWYLSPRHDCLPVISALFPASNSGKTESGVFQYKQNGLVTIDIDYHGAAPDIREVNLLVLVDGKETERIPVDISYDAQCSYVDQYQSGNSHVTMPEMKAYEEGQYSQLFYYLNGVWEIPNGSRQELYVEVVTGDHLHYYSLADSCSVSEKGDPDYGEDRWMWIGAEGVICDEEGSVLYAPEGF